MTAEVPVRGLPPEPPTIDPVAPSQLPEVLQSRLRARMERLGYLGAFFGVAAHQPEALAGFIDFTEALKKSLPGDLAETVALTVASLIGNRYELAQHMRLCRKLNFSEEWIRELAMDEMPVGGSKLTAEQRSCRELAISVVTDCGRGARPGLAKMVSELGPEHTVGVLLLAARFVAHGFVSNALGLVDPLAD